MRLLLLTLIWTACSIAQSVPMAFSKGLPAGHQSAIFWISDPVLPGQMAMVSGDELQQVRSVDIRRIDDVQRKSPTGKMTRVNPRWIHLPTHQPNQHSFKFVIPKALQTGVFAVRIANNDGHDLIRLINLPDPWWIQTSSQNAAPGDSIRIFGKCLSFGGHSQAYLSSPVNRHIDVPVIEASQNSLRLALPASTPSADYTVYIHNGFGAVSGWRRAGSVRVERTAKWPNRIFDVMAYYGAAEPAEIAKTAGHGAEAIDRTDAIHDTLRRCEANGGGIVYFPAGTYSVHGPLLVPPKTVLRGAGEGLVTIWWGGAKFALDGGGDQRRLETNPQSPSVLISGTSFGIENLSLYFPRDYQTAIETENEFHMRSVRVRVDRYWVKSGQREDGVTVRLGPNSSITDCDILAKGVAFAFTNGHNVVIAGNTVYAGKSQISLERGDGVIVEHNRFVSLDPTAYNNLSNEGRNIYYSNNRHESMFAQQSDFSWTFDGYGVAYTGKLAAVNGTTLTLAQSPNYPAWAPESNAIWRRAAVCIVSGRGAGQYRFVQANADKTWTIDRPYDVVPDDLSVVSIVPFRGRVLLLNNHFEDAGWVNVGYGTSIDVICAGNDLFRTGSLLNLGLRDPDGCLPSWYVQYLGNDIHEGQTLVQSTGDERLSPMYRGEATRWSIHRHQHLFADNSGSIDIGGNMDDAVVEDCWLDNPMSTIKVGQHTSNILLRNNRMAPGAHYAGDGLRNAEIDPKPLVH